MSRAIVYVATDKTNGFRYVGVTTLSLAARQRAHMSEVRRNVYGHPFHAALRDRGESFEWRVSSAHSSIDDAVAAEEVLIQETSPEYNSGRPGAGRFGPSSWSRRVVCLTDGKTYESAASAARAYGISNSIVIEVCNRHPRRMRARSHILRYEDDNEGIDAALDAEELRKRAARANLGENMPRPVICLSDGKRYSSATEAARAYGLKRAYVSGVCRGNYAHTNGYMFAYSGKPKKPKLVQASGTLPDAALGDTNEVWVPLPGNEHTYSVSDKGRLCSLDRIVPHICCGGGCRKRGQILKSYPDKDGYEFVALRRSGSKTKRWKIHALVAEAFHGPRPDGMLVLHRNGDNKDNSAGNLYYGTQKQNIADAKRHDVFPIGERQWLAKLTTQDVLEIRAIGARLSQRAMARKFNVSQSTIQRILAGGSWCHLLPDGGS